MERYVWFPGLNIGKINIASGIELFGKFELHFYSLIIACGMALAVFYAFWRFKQNKIKVDTVLDYAVWILPFSIVGARLYYVIFDMIDRPENYFGVSVVNGKEVGSLIGFLYSVVAVWNGGLAIYGGVIAGGIVIFVVSQIKKMNTMKILDIAVPAVLFAQVLGRWGNFFNLEAYGEATKLPWRMCSGAFNNYLLSQGYTIDEVLSGAVGVHPTFLYESLWNLVGVLLMIGTLIVSTLIIKVPSKKHINGFFFAFYMMWYGFGRMFIETLRTDSLWLIPGFIRISVLVAVITFVAGLLLMGFLVTKFVIKQKTGVDIWEKFKARIRKNKTAEANENAQEVENGTNN
jgi:phosphatidylglycerol:prolipoprotein diacylglycerol transferase